MSRFAVTLAVLSACSLVTGAADLDAVASAAAAARTFDGGDGCSFAEDCGSPVAAVVHQASGSSSSASRGSSKCGASRLRTFFDQVIEPCRQQSLQFLNVDIKTYGDLWDANCKQVTAFVNCFLRDSANLCLNDREKTNGGYNVLADEFKMAFNVSLSEYFGQEYIDSCPILRDNEGEVVRRRTYTNRCSYASVAAADQSFGGCVREEADALNDKIERAQFASDANRGPLIIDALCSNRDAVLGRCLGLVQSSGCYAPQGLADAREGTLQGLAGFEARIDGFTYAQFCGFNRKKRSAINVDDFINSWKK